MPPTRNSPVDLLQVSKRQNLDICANLTCVRRVESVMEISGGVVVVVASGERRAKPQPERER
jgi:hypothetical protein